VQGLRQKRRRRPAGLQLENDNSANLQASQDEAAKLLNVSTRTVASAKPNFAGKTEIIV
jgi:hypothetical protein